MTLMIPQTRRLKMMIGVLLVLHGRTAALDPDVDAVVALRNSPGENPDDAGKHWGRPSSPSLQKTMTERPTPESTIGL